MLTMSPEENKAVARRFYEEVFNQGDLDLIPELTWSDFIDHNPGPGQAPGSEGIRQSTAEFRTAFPDVHLTVDDQIAEGDKVVTRLTVQGTHLGEYQGILPTGKPIIVGLIDIVRMRGGKCVERWGELDALSLLEELGAIPAPEMVAAYAQSGMVERRVLQ